MGAKSIDARTGLEIGTTFAAAFERNTPRACPSATVQHSEPLGSVLGDTPIRLSGFFGDKWRADQLEEPVDLTLAHPRVMHRGLEPCQNEKYSIENENRDNSFNSW